MERNGKTLKTLAKGDRRRMSDGKNAWRKMTEEQRRDFAAWIVGGDDAPRLTLNVAGELRKAMAIKGDW